MRKLIAVEGTRKWTMLACLAVLLALAGAMPSFPGGVRNLDPSFILNCKYGPTVKNYPVRIAYITSCLKRLDLTPKRRAWLYFKRGAAYGRLGMEESSLADSTAAVNLMPDYGAAHFNRGASLSSLGREQEAYEAYTEAIRANPADGQAHFRVGKTHLERGELDEALAMFNRAIELRPGYGMALMYRANAYLKTGEPSRAISDLNEALDGNPGNPRLLLLRANAHGMVGNWPQALRDANRLLRDLKNPRTFDPAPDNDAFNVRNPVLSEVMNTATDALPLMNWIVNNEAGYLEGRAALQRAEYEPRVYRSAFRLFVMGTVRIAETGSGAAARVVGILNDIEVPDAERAEGGPDTPLAGWLAPAIQCTSSEECRGELVKAASY